MHVLKLIALYTYVCDVYNQQLRWNVQRFSNNGLQGQITDAELITIYLLCLLYEEKHKLKSMHTHILRYWHSWFPTLPAYQTFASRINRLSDALVADALVADALVALADQLLSQPLLSQPLANGDISVADAFGISPQTFGISPQTFGISPQISIAIGDSMPMLTCWAKRAGKVARQLTDKGYCPSKGIYYYGCKLHLLALRRRGHLPQPCLAGITAASVHDLAALRPALEQLRTDVTVLDKAYCDQQLTQTIKANNNQLLTPHKAKKGLPQVLQHFDRVATELTNRAISALRQAIESLFDWLNEKTAIQNASKVRSQKGLIVHIFGRLAAALLLFHHF